MNLSERLQFYRKKKGLSQEEVAAALNVTRQAVSKWETAAAAPDMETLRKLASLYQISFMLLTGETEGPGRVFPHNSIHWRPGHKLIRPAALDTLQNLRWVYTGLSAIFVIASVYVWAMNAMRITLVLLCCMGMAFIFGVSAAVCNAARSGISALFTEMADQLENMERRFQMLREQVRELEP